MLRASRLALAAALFVAGLSTAQAATISYATPQATTYIGEPSWHFSALSQFNPTLGTLTGVAYHLAGTLIVATWDNLSASDITGKVFVSVGVRLGAPGITQADRPDPFNQEDAIRDAGTPCCSEAVITPGPHSDTSSPFDLSYGASGDISSLIGMGTFNTTLLWSEDSDICRNDADPDFRMPRVLTCGRTGGGFTATVTYTYDPAPPSVPEPASAGVLLSGIAGLLLRRKRFSSR